MLSKRSYYTSFSCAKYCDSINAGTIDVIAQIVDRAVREEEGQEFKTELIAVRSFISRNVAHNIEGMPKYETYQNI